MSLPNPDMDFTPFDVLTAEELDEMVANIEALADGSGIGDGAVTPSKLGLGQQTASESASGTTTSLSYTPTLSGSPGTNPSVTVNIGANGVALVQISAEMFNAASGSGSQMAFAVSGANTIAATNINSIGGASASNGAWLVLSGVFMVTGLNPGSTTFTLEYRARVGSTASFSNRAISVVPL